LVPARVPVAARASGGFSASTNPPGLNIKSKELMSAIAANFDTSLKKRMQL
jgi:hypothetical protein